MTPDDPRHGTYAGAVAHWGEGHRPCPPCATAETRYRKTRKLRALHSDPATVPARGTVRRWQALQAIGWTGPQIAKASGVSVHTLRSIRYTGAERIYAETAAKLADAYDRMAMTVPDGNYAKRARAMAAKAGWAPPLAWDDIDLDEQPNAAPRDTQYDVDPVVVERILAGELVPSNIAERRLVLARWHETGRSNRELADLTGWKLERYTTRDEEDAA